MQSERIPCSLLQGESILEKALIMFFFIGGVQPKTIELDEQPRICSSCGLCQARMKRVDHYISIFFLPILRIKKGEPFLLCEKCLKGHGL